MFRVFNPSASYQTVNDTPVTILTYDGSMSDFFSSGINNWQKWNIEIIAHDSIFDGYSGNMASWRFEFSGKADLGELIIDTYPLVPAYYESDGGASTWDADVSITGSYLLFNVTGAADRSIIWDLYGQVVHVSDEAEPT